MKARVEFIDNSSLTREELEESIRSQFGPNAIVEILPESMDPEYLIKLGIRLLVTDRQVNLMYNDKDLYHSKLKVLRKEYEKKLGYLLNSVIMDNEEEF